MAFHQTREPQDLHCSSFWWSVVWMQLKIFFVFVRCGNKKEQEREMELEEERRNVAVKMTGCFRGFKTTALLKSHRDEREGERERALLFLSVRICDSDRWKILWGCGYKWKDFRETPAVCYNCVKAPMKFWIVDKVIKSCEYMILMEGVLMELMINFCADAFCLRFCTNVMSFFFFLLSLIFISSRRNSGLDLDMCLSEL